jgi:hypothetical protein
MIVRMRDLIVLLVVAGIAFNMLLDREDCRQSGGTPVREFIWIECYDK